MKARLRALPMCLALAALPAGAQADTAQPPTMVTISDSGITPRTITVPLGASVQWTNSGSGVHTATSLPGTVTSFDTGGLGRGQAGTATFGTLGSFSYTSATDCIGNASPGFDCGPYTVTVVFPTSGASGMAQPASSNVAVAIDDTNGFQPANLSVAAGQTVVWSNTGTKVHTVSSDGGYVPGYDSGGLNPGQTFSWTFTNPGVYTYHSSTEPVYFQDPNAGGTNRGFSFHGTVTVLPPSAAQPAPTAVPAPPAQSGLAFAAKDVTTPPTSCGAGNRVPCFGSAPNTGTFYVQGHVLDKSGQGIGGLLVDTDNTGGGGITTVTTDPDGLFTIVFSQPGLQENTYCPQLPFARIYSVWVADPSGRVLSDKRTFPYTNCATAGEFHFDFVKTS